MTGDWAPRRPLIMGFRVTGQAVARVLAGAGAEPLAADDRPTDAIVAEARRLGVPLAVSPGRAQLEELVAACDLVVPAPGVPLGHPLYQLAEEHGVPVYSEVELAWRYLEAQYEGEGRRAPRVVAITGTNGKTTVTTLAGAILQASGIDALDAGNIGLPLIEAVTRPAEALVVEVSSFQLQFTERFHPAVSCWLNLAPDHLDWHPSMAHYTAAKARIWENQGPGDVTVLNAADPAVRREAEVGTTPVPAGVQRCWFDARSGSEAAHDGTPDPVFRLDASFRLDGGTLVGPGGPLVALDDLPRALPHDLANDLAAAAVSLAAGATATGVRHGLVATPALPHRVTLVGEAGGIRYYDDSKATTPASVCAAVAGFDSVVLIAGGRNKGLDLKALAVTAPPVHAVVAIGEAAGEVEACFAGLVALRRADSMDAAVAAATELARPGDAVLLSPGCTSWDWYPSYAVRGDHFARLVTELLEKGRRQP